jgi:hypothetical protein
VNPRVAGVQASAGHSSAAPWSLSALSAINSTVGVSSPWRLLVGAKTSPWATIIGRTVSPSHDSQVRVLHRIRYALNYTFHPAVEVLLYRGGKSVLAGGSIAVLRAAPTCLAVGGMKTRPDR